MMQSQHTPFADTFHEDTTPSPQGSGDSNSDGQKNILIVEDEAGIRAVLEELLFMEGYKTTSAENGDEGIAHLNQNRYDIVFTDLNMPGVSGRDVARVAKERNPDTPVVVVTGWDTNAIGSELIDSGVDRVLKKPFDMMEVLTMVSELTASS